MNKSKSISIRLVTLIKIFIAIIIVSAIAKNINKNNSTVETAEVETNIVTNNIQVANVKIEEELKVSSRSEERNDVTNISDITTANVENVEELNNEENTSEQEKTIENVQEEEIVSQEIEENNYISIEEVEISKNMDITENTGLSKEDFVTLISEVKQDTSGFFEENAETIYDLCQEYELNEIFFCGLISAESGWNIADNHRRTYNYISLMTNGKLIQYSSVEEGLEVAAQKLHNNYLTPGGKFYYGKTLSAVKTKFCPASSTWVDLVFGRMKQIVK